MGETVVIRVNGKLFLDENELEFQAVRASGPGGQNVNRVKTAVQLRFPVAASASLPEPVKRRLLGLAKNAVNSEGVLVIDARRHRTQERNRADSLQRLIELIRRAAAPPKRRVKTRPSRGARERRLAEKRRRGEIKRRRGSAGGSLE